MGVTGAGDDPVLDYDGTTGAILRWYPPGGEADVAAGTRQTLIPDVQGSVIGVLSSTGTLTKVGYQPYGENPSLTTDGMRYTGQQLDSETAGSTSQPSGLYYLRARQYSPTWGRFLTPDPAHSGTNLYAYTDDDPLDASDPSGLDGTAVSEVVVTASKPQLFDWVAYYTYLAELLAQGAAFPSFGGGSSGTGTSVSPVVVIGTKNSGPTQASNPVVLDLKKFLSHSPNLSSPTLAGTNQTPQNACPLVTMPFDNALPTVDPRFSPAFAKIVQTAMNNLGRQGIYPQVNSGYRTAADQLRMRMGASGRNPAAQFSDHELGNAIDINGTQESYFPSIVSAFKAAGALWGGDYRSGVDLPHFYIRPMRANAANTAACHKENG